MNSQYDRQNWKVTIKLKAIKKNNFKVKIINTIFIEKYKQFTQGSSIETS